VNPGGVRKVVIPAAGLGTRFLPATKAQPKEMLPVFDKPAIQHVVEEAVAAGVREVVLITGRNKQAIENHFDRSLELEAFLEASGQRERLDEIRAISNLANLIYIRQKEPLGLGHAVLCARPAVGDETFGVLLADDLIASAKPAIGQLAEVARRRGGSVIAVMEVPKAEVSAYGVVAGDWLDGRVMRVRDMIEKPAAAKAPSRFAIIGRYVLSPRIFALLERTPRGAKGEIQLTDALRALCREEPVYGFRFEGARYDAGHKVGYVEACLAYALRDPECGPKIRALLARMAGGRRALREAPPAPRERAAGRKVARR
jgi:UTP--glucose-1-phosphate uridylyltransferase